ncbi:MAG: carboxyl transferase domain-containing protein [Nitrososphaerota archaeon]
MVTGLAGLNGIPVGVIANQPLHNKGVIDFDAAVKLCRLVRLCSSFNLPIVTFVDTPGFAPGTEQEHRGIVRLGAQIFTAYIDALVPKVSVILGRAYGGGYIAMSSRGIGADYVIGLRSAEVSVLPPDLAAEIIYRKQLDGMSEDSRINALRERELELRARYSGDALLTMGVVDKLVEPEEIRPTLAKVVQTLYARYGAQLTP